MANYHYLSSSAIAALMLDISIVSINDNENAEAEPASLKTRRAIQALDKHLTGFSIVMFDEIIGSKFLTMEHLDPMISRSWGLRIVGYFYDTKSLNSAGTWDVKPETVKQLQDAFIAYQEMQK